MYISHSPLFFSSGTYRVIISSDGNLFSLYAMMRYYKSGDKINIIMNAIYEFCNASRAKIQQTNVTQRPRSKCRCEAPMYHIFSTQLNATLFNYQSALTSLDVLMRATQSAQDHGIGKGWKYHQHTNTFPEGCEELTMRSEHKN